MRLRGLNYLNIHRVHILLEAFTVSSIKKNFQHLHKNSNYKQKMYFMI